MTLRNLISFCLFLLMTAPAAQAAQRDHLTEQEADLVRDTQALDKRIEVFIRAVERRVLTLTDAQASAAKQVQKEMEKWGPLPQGSRSQLLQDIARILDEAITNIDDFSARSPSSELLPKALRKLAEAAARMQTQLETLRANSRGVEREALDRAQENAVTIIEAAKRLPPPPAKK